MTVQCPNCAYSGKLPSNMETGQRKIRCPKCGVRFATQPADIGQRGLPDSEADPNGLSDLAIDLGMSPGPEPQEESAVIPRINVGDLKIDASDDEIPAQTQPRATLPPGRRHIPDRRSSPEHPSVATLRRTNRKSVNGSLPAGIEPGTDAKSRPTDQPRESMNR